MSNGEYELINDKEETDNKLEQYRTEGQDTMNGTEIIKSKYAYFNPVYPGSLKASVFALICVTLGTGMLPLPYFFITNGILLTMAIFLLCGFATLYTLKLLISMAYENKTYVYNELVGKYFGTAMVNYSIVVLMINSLGSIILWNVFIFKFINDIMLYFGMVAHDIHILYCCVFILFFIQIPLAVHKTVAEFSYISTIGILQIIYVIFVLVIEFPTYASRNYDTSFFTKASTYFKFNANLVEMPFAIFISFGNHSTILSVIFEIKNKTHKRVRDVGLKTFYSELLIYIMVLFFSFFSTFDLTKEIFLTRSNRSFLMMVGEFMMCILMLCNISLYYYMMTPMLELLFNDSQPFKFQQSILAAFTVLTVLMFVSFYVDKVLSILSFLGASAQVSLIFIIPISLQLKRRGDDISWHEKAMYISMLIFFTFFGMAGFLLMIYRQLIQLF